MRLSLKAAIAIVVYHGLLAMVLVWIGGRTADRFTGMDARRHCEAIRELQERTLGAAKLRCGKSEGLVDRRAR